MRTTFLKPTLFALVAVTAGCEFHARSAEDYRDVLVVTFRKKA